ncbi:MAG: PP2C family protein-serine/threonine phosphatase, partial [Desulfomonilia bacterium]|nr:PP2C family protein-serine/threonine phosphatase [Desulfomonilia bacterium]
VVESTCSYTVVSFIDVTHWVSRQDNLEDLLLDAQSDRGLGGKHAGGPPESSGDIANTQERIEEQHRTMLHQMEIAARLQRSLLPDIHQHFNGIIVSSKFVPSKHIGGDLYDVIDLGHGLTGVLIADVSGHGVASALISSMFKMIFHSLAETVTSPKILFHLINQELTSILREDFISAFYVLADCRAKTITFTNAAHPNPLLFKRKTSEMVELDTDGLFLGMFEDGLYEEQCIPGIEEGDVLLLYTDCIIEEQNEQGTPYGKSRLKDMFFRIVQEYAGQDIIDLLEDDLHCFCGRENLEDDFTMLVLEFNGQRHVALPDDDPTDTRDELSEDGFVSF